MKKVYEKPQIMFESFSLSTNIAGDCEYKPSPPTLYKCGLDFADGTIFLDSMADVCSPQYQMKSEGGDGAYGNLCYHVPNDGINNMFNS